MTLAIFDLDNTLLAGDSDHSWGEFIADLGVVDGSSYRAKNDAFYDDYCRGALDIFAYQRFVLAPLAGFNIAELTRWHEQFMREKIEPIVLPKAQALVDNHRAQGHTLMIITATNSFITTPIAKRFGIDILIATTPEQKNGIYTGDIVGVPCYREGKVERLNAWLAENNETLYGSYFYSDSHNDLPLLQRVDHPVAVDPDDTLRKYAKDNGWQILNLR
ncbi:MAG TPA: HAD family hydrolase [Pseudomonadales bacterium]|nr:HAD family hydrolase [Pseudomonadales bacterium]